MTRQKSFEVPFTTPSAHELRQWTTWDWHLRQAGMARALHREAQAAGIPYFSKGEFREVQICSLRQDLLRYEELIGGCRLLLEAMREAKLIGSLKSPHLKVEYSQVQELERPRTRITVSWGGVG